MKLYYAAASPFVRTVLVCLHEANLINQVELVEVAITPVSPGETVPSRSQEP